MKVRLLYFLVLFLLGILASFSINASNKISPTGAKLYNIVKSPSANSQKQPKGDSPFIRFHSGIDKSGISIPHPPVAISFLKPVNNLPEKFAGIIVYLSTLSYWLPVTEEIFYSTPLRSPPFFC
jgi:hypothetical protein